jgi:hypothetical protein
LVIRAANDDSLDGTSVTEASSRHQQQRPASPEVTTMLLADCPLCDGPAPVDPATGDLDCDACGVRLEVASDIQLAELPLAA